MSEENNTKTSDLKEREIGAFWSKTKQGSDEKYLTGYIEVDGTRYDLVCFRNNLKQEGENTPDLRVYKGKKLSSKANNNAAPF